MPTKLAQKAFEEYQAYNHGKPHANSMHMHWARLIETLHAAEMIKELLVDPAITGKDIQNTDSKAFEGIGVIEAPRGTLFHHYQIDDNDLITLCNLIVSTTQNNTPMNRAVEWVAHQIIEGHDVIPESMLNQVEVAIRAYDPCLSCATHAMGKMPLQIQLENHLGQLIDEKIKN
jgi:NAD-reducing hydrogenase large subunit